MKYLIPLILGLIIFVIYLLFFGAPVLIGIIENAFSEFPV